MMKTILTSTVVLSMLACSARGQEPGWQFFVTAWIDGVVTTRPHDGPGAPYSRFLAPLAPEPRPVWDIYATMVEGGASLRVHLDPPETPGFDRTIFVPAPEAWHDPVAPWHWPDEVIYDETVEWIYTYSDPSQGCVRCEELRSRRYTVRLDSFGPDPTVWHVTQVDLDEVLLNWGGPSDSPLIEGIVDQSELDLVLSNWGGVARPPFLPPQVDPFAMLGVTAVPEPAAWVLGLVVGGLWWRCRPS